MLFVVDGQKPLKAFLLSYLTGFVFFLITIYWLVHVTLFGMIVVVLYMSSYFGLFGLVCSFFTKRASLRTLFLLPAAWVILEWVRSHLFTGFGWALLSHSQVSNTSIIQIADTLGAYGISFLVILVNVAIFMTIKGIRTKDYKVTYIFVALSLVFITIYYGIFMLKSVFTGEKIKVAVIQGNIPQSEKWDRQSRVDILRKYERLTKIAAKRDPDLIIWPETSVPAFIKNEPVVDQWLGGLAIESKAALLVGAPSEGEGKSIEDMPLYNSAILYNDEGQIVGQYNKVHLVPFGEYVPFKKALSFVERFAPSPIGDFSHGEDSTVLQFFIDRSLSGKDSSWHVVKKVKFACLICFEDIFPSLARKAVLSGATFLVNMTNDAWFKYSSAPYQHAASSVFRAVENRVNVIRAANTGYSCFINQKGEVVAEVTDGDERIFIDGFVCHDIDLNRPRTFYTRYGDVFVYGCIAFVLIGILRLYIDNKPKRG